MRPGSDDNDQSAVNKALQVLAYTDQQWTSVKTKR